MFYIRVKFVHVRRRLLGRAGVWRCEDGVLFTVCAGTQRCRPVTAATAMCGLHTGTGRVPARQKTPRKQRSCQASQ